MNELFLVVAVAITSAGAYIVGRRIFGLPRAGLPIGLLRMLECLGISAVFFVLDVLVGVVLVLGVRVLTRQFVSLYVMADAVLVPFALLQGLAFWWWRRTPPEA